MSRRTKEREEMKKAEERTQKEMWSKTKSKEAKEEKK